MESNNKSKIKFLSEKQNNQKNTILISHRLRGFDDHDATRIGLMNAILSGIKYIEIDLRITKDKQIVINHDPHLKEHFNSSEFISKLTLDEIKNIHYKNSDSNESILTLQELLALFNQYKKSDSFLFLDIKEYGLEENIISEITNRNLLNNIIIISWLPEVLFKVHSINSNIKLCFSFIPVLNQLKYFLLKLSFDIIHLNKFLSLLSKLFSIKIINNFKYTNYIFNNYDCNELEKYKLKDYLGKDYEHILSEWLNKNLLNILQNVNGMICVPYKLIDNNFVDRYHKLGIKVMVFSINYEKVLNKYLDSVKPDFILTDKKEFLFK
ncbi:MAG: hypothetical protein STSR0008_01660 [Ignavibacterium sp.]